MTRRVQLPQLKVSVLALGSALAALAGLSPDAALAVPVPDCGVGAFISTISSPVQWSTGNCLILSGGVITPSTQDAAINATGTGAGTLTNNGAITSPLYGVYNTGTIGTVLNTGAITGSATGSYGVLNAAGATITAFNNFGAGTISGVSAAIINNGVITSFNNQAGALITGSQLGLLNNGGTIQNLGNGGVMDTSVAAISNAAGTISSVYNTGTISSPGAAISNAALVVFLTNAGRVAGTGSASSTGISNSGGITVLNNTGTITSLGKGVSNNAGGTIATVSNAGTINSVGVGIYNSASTITGIANPGLINSSSDYGVSNSSGTIASISNAGTISGGGLAAINNAGGIGSLSNTGLISGVNAGITNGGGISGLINSGIIRSTSANAITNTGTIGAIINNAGGTIGAGSSSTAVYTVFNAGYILNLTNSGLINGVTGVRTEGTIGTLTNFGTLTGSLYALDNASSGTITSVINTGVTAGNIRNTSTRDLKIYGGTGTVVGTLTGYGGGIDAAHIGLITNPSSNVQFGNGSLLLNDNIDVTGHSVINASSSLQVNNPLTITGDYMQNAVARLTIGVGSNAVSSGVASADSNYGRLVVSGTATIAPNSVIALKKTGTYAFAQGQRYVVVQAANANYNAGQLNYLGTDVAVPITGAAVVDTDDASKTDLVLTLGVLPVKPVVPTPTPAPPPAPINNASDSNTAVALTGLFRYAGTNDGMLTLFNAAAATGGTGEVDRVAAQLNPAATGAALVQSAGAAGQAVATIAAAHVDAVRVAQAGNGGVAAGDSPRDIAMWGQAFGGQAKQSDRAEAAGYTAGYNGLLIGADTAVNDLWRAGALVSYANTSIASSGNNAGSSGHVNAYGVTGYAGYTADTWYLNLSAGVARQKYDTLRTVNFTGFSGAAFGQFNGTQYITSVEAGYPIRLDAATTLTPIAGLTYSKLNQDAYTETGSAVALHMASASTSSVKSDLGAKLDRSWQTAYGDLTPSAQLGWRHEYRNTSVQAVSNFAADTTGSTSFTTQGPTAARDTGVLVLGATLARTSNLTLAAHYTVEAASGFTAQTADLRLRYQF